MPARPSRDEVRRPIVAIIACLLFLASSALMAQESTPGTLIPPRIARALSESDGRPRLAVSTLIQPLLRASRRQPAAPRPSPKLAGGVRGAVLGAIGGAVVGGLVGALVEHYAGCGCADTPIKGFLIGAPLGALPGAVIGFRLATR
jgi:hypothetical protein